VTSALNNSKEVWPTEYKLPPGPGGGIQKYGHPANGSAAVRPILPLTWRGFTVKLPSPARFLFRHLNLRRYLHKRNGSTLRAIFGSGEGWAIRSFFGFGWWMEGLKNYVVIKAVLALDLAKGGSSLP
jgi:hypothetical protein